jgi:molybdopterin synthase sulfur carrier subunit
VKVLIPSPLRSYTGASEVDAEGTTLAEVLADLDRRHPGLRFRIVDEQERMRPHVRFFVNGDQAFELDRRLRPGDSVQIVQALSGG